MRVSLLGPVVAQLGDAVVDLGGTKQRAVFALLAMQPGRVVPVDRLIDELWHADPPAQATVTLRAYVSRLRRALAGGDVQIRTRPPGWLLDIAPEDVDLVDFHHRLARARALLAPPDAAPAVVASGADQLVAALGLWRGEVCADLQSLGVGRGEAARAEDARSAAVELLLETRLRLGQHDDVVDDARAFVTAQPFRERGWAALVLALYRSGRQSDAVAAVKELRTALADELGLDPSPRIRELERQVLRQDPALLPARPTPDLDVPVADLVPAAAGTPFVGRETTMRLVDGCLAAARAGRGCLLVLESEAGAGKTTVLGELARRAGGRVVHGGGGGAGSMPALWSWVTVVRALSPATDSPGTEAATAAMTTARVLMGAPADGCGSAATDLALSRTALYRGVVELLAAAHRETPLTVVVDDLQWVDDETLTLLSLAVDELAPHGVLFAVAVRSDEPDARRVLAALTRTPRHLLVRHRLGGLDPAAVAQLVTRTTGRPVDEQVTSALHVTTAGNPLFVTELIRLLAAERRLDLDGIATALPEQVHDVLRRRIERLPAASIGLMQVIALSCGPVDVELLASVTGRPPDQVLDDVEVTLLAGLVVESADGLHPGHDLVRKALVVGLSAARRLRLHARIAAALQVRGDLGPDKVLEVAHHLAAAAPAVGPAAAIPYLISACEDAVSRYATLTAGRILDEALALAGRIADPAVRAETEQRVLGRLVMVRVYAAADILPGTRPPLLLDDDDPESWGGAATLTAVTGEVVRARDAADAALRTPRTPRAEVGPQLVRGFTSYALGDLDAAQRSLERALDLAERGATDGFIGLIAVVTEAASGFLAMIAHLRGDEEGAVAALDDAVRASTGEAGRVNLELFGCLLAGMRGDPEAGRDHASRTIALAERLESGAYVLQGRIVDAWAAAVLAAREGRRPDATALASAVAAYQATGLTIYLPTYVLLLAEVHELAGEPAAARSAVEAARVLTRRTGEVPHGARLEAVARRWA